MIKSQRRIQESASCRRALLALSYRQTGADERMISSVQAFNSTITDNLLMSPIQIGAIFGPNGSIQNRQEGRPIHLTASYPGNATLHEIL